MEITTLGDHNLVEHDELDLPQTQTVDDAQLQLQDQLRNSRFRKKVSSSEIYDPPKHLLQLPKSKAVSFIGIGNTPLILEAIEESPNSRPVQGKIDNEMKDVGFTHMIEANMQQNQNADEDPD